MGLQEPRVHATDAWVFMGLQEPRAPATEYLSVSSQAKPMSLLHVFHHSVVVVMAYLWLEAAQSLQQVALLTNTAIHVIMYWYYLLSVLKRPPAWKKVVTTSQIAQFVFRWAKADACSASCFLNGELLATDTPVCAQLRGLCALLDSARMDGEVLGFQGHAVQCGFQPFVAWLVHRFSSQELRIQKEKSVRTACLA